MILPSTRKLGVRWWHHAHVKVRGCINDDGQSVQRKLKPFRAIAEVGRRVRNKAGSEARSNPAIMGMGRDSSQWSSSRQDVWMVLAWHEEVLIL